MSDRLRADIAMIVVALFWGLTFPLIRGALEQLSAQWFVLLRFGSAAILFVPLLFVLRVGGGPLRQALLPGLVLGFIAWTSYFAQTLGLQTVGAGRAAFLTGTNVIMVPLLSPLFGAGRPRRVDLVAAAVAMLGMILLTDPQGGGLGRGDLWILFCALSYAIYIHVLSIFTRHGHAASCLAFLQIFGIALCAGALLSVVGAERPEPGRTGWIAIGICAVFATVLTFWLQAHYQRRTTPERVALIFSLEPVFAAAFAYWLLGEWLRPLSLAGAILILAAVAGAEWSSARASRLPKNAEPDVG